MPATESGFYRAHYVGDAAHPAGFVSAPVGISVVPRLTAALSSARATAGTSVIVKGTIGPAKPNLEILIDRSDNGRLRALGSTS